MKKGIFTFLAFVVTQTMMAQAPVKVITGNLNGTTNWVKDTIYKLSGKVYVKAGGTLNIAPGTIIKGDKSVPGSALIITRGAKLMAVGTPTEPIVFTSSEPAGSRATADWGGIVLAGNAVVNVTGGIGTIEGGNLANPDGTTSDGQYGGLNNLDNSGDLEYVRIEFAGYAYALNNELNGLTLAGVGSGTKLSHIQVSYGFDDSYEFFGGTVSADHLISYRGNDDDFDTDFGFSGKVQFGVALRDTAVADAVSGSNGFESDNDGSGTGANPYTSAVFSNMTIVGPLQTPTTTINPNFKRGAHIRRNSRESVFNSIIMGWPVGVLIDGDSCHRNADSSWLRMKNNAIAACVKPLDSTGGATGWGVTPWFMTGNSNTLYAQNSDIMLTAPFNYAAPDFRPSTGSPMLTGASFTDTKLTTGFDNTPTYLGAFGADNWMNDWASFTPETNPYLYGIGVAPTEVNTVQAQQLAITLYPNPAKNISTLSFNVKEVSKVSVEVLDMNGKSLYSTTQSMNAGSHQVKINTENFANGIYFVKVNTGNTSGNVKLSVVR